LVEGYDFLIFEDCWLDPYSLRQEEDMKYAIENGLSAFMTVGRSCVTYTAWGWYGWHTSVLRELMPIKFTEDAASSIMHRNAGFTVKIVRDDPPVFSMFKPFGIEGIAGVNNAWLEPRMGSTIWGEMAHPFRSPTGSKAWMVSWKVGDGGHFWNDADDLNFPWWDPYLNEYAPDIFMNVLLYSTDRELPKDIVIVHNVRRQYWLYSQYSAYLFSLFAFVEKFGASTLRLVDEMEQIDLQREQSFDEFREQRYQESLATILSSMDKMEELEVKTFRLKDTTLMWVYLIQWASVTSVLMISGVVLWSLMVRRRLFHEVSVTKLTQELDG
jgi:hypothetical protein